MMLKYTECQACFDECQTIEICDECKGEYPCGCESETAQDITVSECCHAEVIETERPVSRWEYAMEFDRGV